MQRNRSRDGDSPARPGRTGRSPGSALRTEEAPADVTALRCDIGDRRADDTAVAEAAEACDGLDVLISNAGLGAVGAVDANDDAQWARVLDVNVTGIARTTTAALLALSVSPDSGCRSGATAPGVRGERYR
ncbi:SDR family NAD(P)-dependent oxidoreductase [Streptomyces sp. NPDC101175]|uniref:SDR family NAD(P)-dependent oxidoreductase n=1 Tax=Streptomyces sp. NPDC101175 TaxID=3366123 RepID=UPI003839306F